MSATIMEGRLNAALGADAEFAVRGYATVALPSGGIAIERNGTTLGLWNWLNGRFELRIPGEAEAAATAETVAEAVHFSRSRIIFDRA